MSKFDPAARATERTVVRMIEQKGVVPTGD